MKLPDGTVVSDSFRPRDPNLSHGDEHRKRFESLKLGTIIAVRTVDSSDGLQESEDINEDSISGTPYETVYDVRIDDHNSRPFVFSGCRALKPFMGINNFFDMIHESSDLADGFSYGDLMFQSDAQGLVGSRCVIGCIEQHYTAPVILGFLQHPARPSKITSDMGTHLELEFNGINISIDQDGAFNLIGTGPKIIPPTPPFVPVAPLDIPQDPTIGPFTITLDKDMIFTVSDNIGQTFTIDRSTPQIMLSNSTGESFTIDTSGGNIAIVINEAFTVDPSFGDHFEVSSKEGIQGSTPAAGGTSFSFKNGEVDITSAQASLSLGQDGSVSMDAGTDFAITAKTGFSVESETTISIKGAGGELLDLINQLITAIGGLTAASPVGPCAPLMAAPQWAQVQQLLTQLQLNMG